MIRKLVLALQIVRVGLIMAAVALPMALAAAFWPQHRTFVPPLAARTSVTATTVAPEVKLPDRPTTVQVPILMYHETPADFDGQMGHLQAAGYTTIGMDELAAGMQGSALPLKPVVVTFDDGYANQLQAYDVLKRRGMKATFYVINAGEASGWCIGAGRRPGNCGDAYLTWDQVRRLDRSGVVSIQAHTTNHRDLATLPADEQRFEIAGGKAVLERELGHRVRHLAYPYGSYNADSLRIAREAGFVTAVTTAPGTVQAAGSEFTLLRVRDGWAL